MGKLADEIITLPRGGYILDTSVGYIQFSSPPETIKDSMLLKKGVPQFFVLPTDFFSWIKGISVAEVEFPIYYNFFVKKRKTYLICNREQFTRFQLVLNEALFGPQDLRIEEDFETITRTLPIPDIQKEIDYFRNNMKLSDLVSFGIFQDNKINISNITIEIDDKKDFRVIDQGKVTTVPGIFNYQPKYDIGERLPEPFLPPLFGVTCLGPSHGFDPKDNTSGFIIWLNRNGIMVDPPVNSTEWLKDSNVNPKYIDSIILTHCHADHDAGTFQKILEEGKIKVYSTKTIIDSFLRKYSSLINTSEEYLRSLFTFQQVKVGMSEFIHCGQFDFFYSLHSIPTIGFKLHFQDRSFVYSSDHNNDPILHQKLLETKVITKERYQELSNFPWESDVIYHESGIAPLHTPVEVLNSLSENIQKKIVVYHIAKKDFPKKTHLTLAQFGIQHTLYFQVNPPNFEKAYQILGVLNFLDFFDDMPISKAQQFLGIVEEQRYKKNDVIIKKGTKGDRFYIIYSGNVGVITEDLKVQKIYGACDYFGEGALVTGKTRAADVVAKTDVVLFTIEKDKFLNFIKNTEFEKTLLNLIKTRDSETWNLLSTSHVFGILTSTQKTILESMLHLENYEGDHKIIEENQPLEKIYIIKDGSVQAQKWGKTVATLGRGDFIGSMSKIMKNEVATYTFYHKNPVSLYSVKKDEVLKFLQKNPGLINKLVHDF
ncbi:MAG: cyclic nucleotide-binding domain-containing protein [Spirochaetes bacterium]|nr:cyclic nucleotide-binding domain-containing protein [Spirochaetota bacterium]